MNPIIFTKNIVVTSPDDILFLEAASNYTIIHLANGRKMVSGYTLKYSAAKLRNQTFVQINRSICLNVAHISTIQLHRKISYIKIKDGRQWPVSRRRVKCLQQLEAQTLPKQ